MCLTYFKYMSTQSYSTQTICQTLVCPQFYNLTHQFPSAVTTTKQDFFKGIQMKLRNQGYLIARESVSCDFFVYLFLSPFMLSRVTNLLISSPRLPTKVGGRHLLYSFFPLFPFLIDRIVLEFCEVAKKCDAWSPMGETRSRTFLHCQTHQCREVFQLIKDTHQVYTCHHYWKCRSSHSPKAHQLPNDAKTRTNKRKRMVFRSPKCYHNGMHEVLIGILHWIEFHQGQQSTNSFKLTKLALS